MEAGTTISYLVAALGGLLSFLSPCVLPLLPSYVSFITGLSFEDLEAAPDRRTVRRTTLVHSLLFIMGFSLIFILLGTSASALGQVLLSNQRVLELIGGGLIIVFGVYITGIVPLPFLEQERRLHLRDKPLGYMGTVLVGVAFGAGWTPCIGPILGSILVLAGTSGQVWHGVSLLAVYSAGLGVPFLLSAVAFNSFLAAFERFRRYLRYIRLGSGILLILVGVLIFTGQFAILAAWLNRILLPYFPFLERI